MTKMFSLRLSLQNSKKIYAMRFYCQPGKLVPKSGIQRIDEKRRELDFYRQETQAHFQPQFWNESYQVRKERKKATSIIKNIKGKHDLLEALQNLNKFPSNFTELYYYFKRRQNKNLLAEQKYLPQRVAILKPDLAAAHFIIRRFGSVKFVGQPQWVGVREKNVKLPVNYVPGMLVEGIKAEYTNLLFEGLRNMEKLRHIKYLSLKNLETINDWCLDWISKEYYLTLTHLDISGCKNITYRALSCFYRFECLETLEVEGIPDTPEFKLGCLMLLDIMPKLDIKGIDLSVPKKIETMKTEEIKHIHTS